MYSRFVPNIGTHRILQKPVEIKKVLLIRAELIASPGSICGSFGTSPILHIMENHLIFYLLVSIIGIIIRFIVWNGIIGALRRRSGGKNFLSISGMLADIVWGDVGPLVYCGCISVAPECLLVCCSGLDDK